jgi:hypothetical protein
MNGGLNADSTAWLSPEGAKFLAEQYFINKWTNYEVIEEEYDTNTVEMFFFYLKEMRSSETNYGT